MSGTSDSHVINRKQRLRWLDVARGVALVAMAIYHFSWDLEMFGYLDPGTAGTGPLKWFARSIASSFLVLVGISLVLAHAGGIQWTGFRKRFAQIVVAALVISIATWFATPDSFIFFGILHHIALASLLGLLFLRLPVAGLLGAAAAVIAINHLVQLPALDSRWMVWTGLAATPPVSNDFVPVFPWFAFVLFGMVLGRIVALRRSMATVETASEVGSLQMGLAFLGRHSLATYLVHQPVLIALVYLYSLAFPAPPPSPEALYDRFFSSCMSTCVAENSETFCLVYCDCALTGMIDAGMMGETTLPAEAAQTKRDAIIQQCTRQTLEETSD